MSACVYSLTNPERIYKFTQKLACLFFESTKQLQKCRNTEKIVMGSSPGEDGSCSWKAKNDTITKLFVSTRKLLGKRPQTQTMSWFRDPVKMVVWIIFSMIFDDSYEIIRPIRSFRTMLIDSKCKEKWQTETDRISVSRFTNFRKSNPKRHSARSIHLEEMSKALMIRIRIAPSLTVSHKQVSDALSLR